MLGSMGIDKGHKYSKPLIYTHSHTAQHKQKSYPQAGKCLWITPVDNLDELERVAVLEYILEHLLILCGYRVFHIRLDIVKDSLGLFAVSAVFCVIVAHAATPFPRMKPVARLTMFWCLLVVTLNFCLTRYHSSVVQSCHAIGVPYE